MSDAPKLLALPEEQLQKWGVESLGEAIAIDSQSDETSDTMPSTEGQRRLSEHLKEYFQQLGLAVESDACANLMVTIPAHPDHTQTPTLALMAHLDTSRGTQAIDELFQTPAWDGSPIGYPANERLCVSVEAYPETKPFVGEDLLHGPGVAPIGLDNKLGMCEIMAMARGIAQNPSLRHGELVLVFRPDEEIGRMEVLENLADTLKAKDVRYGYTIDGMEPFEVNVENFNAARGRVELQGHPLDLPPAAAHRRVVLEVLGVKSHGATAKAEGYRNATVILTQAMQTLGEGPSILPIDMASDATAEVNAEITFLLRGQTQDDLEATEDELVNAFRLHVTPHRLRGADLRVKESTDVDAPAEITDEGRRLVAHLQRFLSSTDVGPLLSEDSEGYEGYSNPYFVQRTDSRTLALEYRLRAFTPEELEQRGEHLRKVCWSDGDRKLPVTIDFQYINMGPALAPYPELVTWADEAAQAMGASIVRNPIRGGTGVDPFLEREIPIANLGTGYFAPESEKEFTSRQTLGRHAQWLLHLVQTIALHT